MNKYIICALPQFHTYVSFLCLFFIFFISGVMLHLLLLPFFSKCFPFPPFSVHVPHLPCWSHLFPKDCKCDEWRYH